MVNNISSSKKFIEENNSNKEQKPKDITSNEKITKAMKNAFNNADNFKSENNIKEWDNPKRLGDGDSKVEQSALTVLQTNQDNDNPDSDYIAVDSDAYDAIDDTGNLQEAFKNETMDAIEEKNEFIEQKKETVKQVETELRYDETALNAVLQKRDDNHAILNGLGVAFFSHIDLKKGIAVIHTNPDSGVVKKMTEKFTKQFAAQDHRSIALAHGELTEVLAHCVKINKDGTVAIDEEITKRHPNLKILSQLPAHVNIDTLDLNHLPEGVILHNVAALSDKDRAIIAKAVKDYIESAVQYAVLKNNLARDQTSTKVDTAGKKEQQNTIKPSVPTKAKPSEESKKEKEEPEVLEKPVNYSNAGADAFILANKMARKSKKEAAKKRSEERKEALEKIDENYFMRQDLSKAKSIEEARMACQNKVFDRNQMNKILDELNLLFKNEDILNEDLKHNILSEANIIFEDSSKQGYSVVEIMTEVFKSLKNKYNKSEVKSKEAKMQIKQLKNLINLISKENA